jgi:hypothetical protein
METDRGVLSIAALPRQRSSLRNTERNPGIMSGIVLDSAVS